MNNTIKILVPILKGILDGTPILGNISKMISDYKNKTKPDANLVYVLFFVLQLTIVLFFLLGKIDLETTEDLIKIVD